jgi:tetratricopeptide (TPR) repeat protein
MTASGQRLDELADLEEQRRFLLRSLDDLEREREAGDIDEVDYEALKAEYTIRAASVLRRIEGTTDEIDRTARVGHARTSPTRRFLVAGAVALTAIGVGVFVARSAGERSDGGLLTGGDRVTQATTPEQDAALRLLEAARSNLATDRFAAIKDFDSAWKLDKRLVEAPTYAGWLMRLSAQGVEDPANRTLLLEGARARLDEAIAADPNYPDARAFRGVIRLRDLNDATGAKADFDALERLDPPEEIRQLVAGAQQEATESAGQASTSTAP